MEKLGDPDRVAAFFGVGRGMLLRRLSDIGLLASPPVNFLDAERQIGGAPPPRPAAPAEPLALAAPADSTPRSYAASTYGAMERATGAPATRGKPSPAGRVPPAKPAPANDATVRASLFSSASQPVPSPVADAQAPAHAPAERRSPDQTGQGMARLRELARRLDKGAPKG
jgi:hypothetical protein